MESIIIFTVSTDGPQTPLLIVHANELIPNASPFTVDEFKFGFVMLPLPLIKVQIPVPVSGEFPFNVTMEVLPQIN
jgi:hypothetical protein